MYLVSASNCARSEYIDNERKTEKLTMPEAARVTQFAQPEARQERVANDLSGITIQQARAVIANNTKDAIAHGQAFAGALEVMGLEAQAQRVRRAVRVVEAQSGGNQKNGKVESRRLNPPRSSTNLP
jgi:hypothetical protein